MNLHKNQISYNRWATQYDTNINKTRDLEAVALRSLLKGNHFNKILEIGCGTGKNTVFLQTLTTSLTAVDFSTEMLHKAKEKIKDSNIQFIEADILQPWNFVKEKYDLISFSLVLEHIEDLDFIFTQVAEKLTENGMVYIGELHPFKQYSGSLARFETEEGMEYLSCFTHHLSEFTQTAQAHGFQIHNIKEWFDEGDEKTVPRIISMVFQLKK